MQILSCHSLVAKSEQKRLRPGLGLGFLNKFFKNFFKKKFLIFTLTRVKIFKKILKIFLKFFSRARRGFSREIF